jgi:trehalose 2-sulfotransferase
LTESQVNCPDFDHPLCPVKTKLIICSTARSGSYLLCRAMIHHGLGVPHEYLNGGNAWIIANRFGLLNFGSPDLEIDSERRRAYLSILRTNRTVNGIFAVKIQGGQYAQYLRNAPSEELFRDAKFIHLFREDLLAQAISFHVSLLTGRWGRDEMARTRVVPNPQFFDRATIESQIQILADQDREWRLFFARNGIQPLILTYEGIKSNLPEALRKIVAYAKIELPAYEFDYSEPSGDFQGSDEPSKSVIKEWFLRAKR